MKKIIGLTTVAFALSALSAFAQAPPEPSPLPKAPPEVNAENSSPPPPDAPRPDMGPRGPMDHHRPPPPDRGARFHIEEGRTRLDVRCADGDSTKECGDVLLQILDRLQSSSSDEGDSGRGFSRDRERGYDRDQDRR